MMRSAGLQHRVVKAVQLGERHARAVKARKHRAPVGSANVEREQVAVPHAFAPSSDFLYFSLSQLAMKRLACSPMVERV
ncbi:hypothetical protein SDC9_196723 [bioreactor metagenome]|uniref:Uncharacterized protein n=1 Tax=bioreactor metagenome TaxID=1076179 RepID=A0A645IDA0_9ZZZZ